MDRFFRRFICSLLLLSTATTLVAAPPEPFQKPVKLLGFGEGVDREFSKLSDIGITPFLAYYGVYQGNLVGGVQEQRSAYSHLILFGAKVDFLKLTGFPRCSLVISGARRKGAMAPGGIGGV